MLLHTTTKVDPAFKFYSQISLMINSNDDIDEGCANGTLGLYFTSILLTCCKHILLIVLINTIEISVCTKYPRTARDQYMI